MNDLTHILVDEPLPGVRRITLNRPEKRNALNNRLRAEIFATLEAHAGGTQYADDVTVLSIERVR